MLLDHDQIIGFFEGFLSVPGLTVTNTDIGYIIDYHRVLDGKTRMVISLRIINMLTYRKVVDRFKEDGVWKHVVRPIERWGKQGNSLDETHEDDSDSARSARWLLDAARRHSWG